MSKYEMPMEITPHFIPAMLMDRIPLGADVLEFGCATGRMTRYMKEEKGCCVWIVELDKDAYDATLPYACGGWCGDAERLDWLAALGEQRFDRILFADVLEHLRNPDRVLAAASSLLREDGEVLVSIPNIAHFDILANLVDNRFPYTDLGLLDNTHVHFWGYQDLPPLFERAGLAITVLDGCYVEPSKTEQKPDWGAIPAALWDALAQTPLHTVYQYFIAACRTDWARRQGLTLQNRLNAAGGTRFAFYWDFGEGYQAGQCVWLYPRLDAAGCWRFSLRLPEQCRHVRFDPCNGMGCLMRRLQAVSDRGPCDAAPMNGVALGEQFLFTVPDPQVELTVPAGAEAMEITVSVCPITEPAWLRLIAHVAARQQTAARLEAENDRLHGESLRLTQEIDRIRTAAEAEKAVLSEAKAAVEAALTAHQAKKNELERYCANLTEEKSALENSLTRMAEEKTTLESGFAQMTEEKAAIEIDLARVAWEKTGIERQFEQLNAEKEALDEASQQLRDENHALAASIVQLEEDAVSLSHALSRSRDETQTLAAQYAAISDAQCWKLTAPLRSLLDAIKRTRWGALIHKGLRYWRVNGLSAAVRKALHYKKSHSQVEAAPSPVLMEAFPSFNVMLECLSEMEGCKVYLSQTLSSYDTGQGRVVLLLSHELDLTGAPVALMRAAECLLEHGDRPVLVSPHDGNLAAELERRKLPTLVCPQLFTSELVRCFAGLFDVVIANTIVSAPAVSALYGLTQPIIWWIHEAAASYHPAAVAALPEHLPENVRVYAGGAYAKAQLLRHRPNWNVNELLYCVPDLTKMERTTSLLLPPEAAGKRVFLCVGTLEQRKGQDLLAQALEALSPSVMRRGYYLFLGRRCYPGCYEAVQGLCGRYPKNVKYLPELQIDALYQLYEQMDYLVCPSRDDPMPIVVAEALSKSKLVICSANTGSAAILREDGSGLVYDNDDPIALAGCIQQILEGGGGLDEMRVKARRSYETHFSQEVFAENFLSILSGQSSALSVSLPVLSRKADGDWGGTVSIVIPTYQAGSDMVTLLKSLSAQRNVGTVEIVTVDSGSTDGTPDRCRSYGAKVIEIPQDKFSHSYARNLGAKSASGDILVFMTQDALPENELWVSALIAPILAGRAVASSGREQCPAGTDLYYQIASSLHSDFIGIGAEDCFNSLTGEETALELRAKASLNDVATAIRADIFSRFLYRFSYAEDLDMGIRLLKFGLPVALLHSVRIIHGHNRPAGYYLRRAYVEGQSFSQILPELGAPRRADGTVARMLLYGGALLSQTLETAMAACPERCETERFFAQLQLQHASVLKTGVASCDWLIRQDIQLRGYLTLIQKIEQTPCAEEAALAQDVIHYYVNYVKPFLLGQGIVEMDRTWQAAASECGVKQFCANAGLVLAGVGADSPLYPALQELAKGV